VLSVSDIRVSESEARTGAPVGAWIAPPLLRASPICHCRNEGEYPHPALVLDANVQ